MIWFTCKQCGKTHGRAETSAGSMVFCECGTGTMVPWESTAAEPAESAAEPAVAIPLPTLEPVSFDRGRTRAPSTRPRRRSPAAPNPNFCLNHESVPSQKTCPDCGESFCNDCVLTFEGSTLCGPCKNFRVRALHRPPRLSGLALWSLLIALVTGPLAFCLLGAQSLVWSVIGVVPHVIALVLGVMALRATARNPKLTGQALALTAILTAGLSAIMTLLLAVFAPGL